MLSAHAYMKIKESNFYNNTINHLKTLPICL